MKVESVLPTLTRRIRERQRLAGLSVGILIAAAVLKPLSFEGDAAITMPAAFAIFTLTVNLLPPEAQRFAELCRLCASATSGFCFNAIVNASSSVNCRGEFVVCALSVNAHMQSPNNPMTLLFLMPQSLQTPSP